MSVESNPYEWIRLAEMDLATSHHMFKTYCPIPLEIVCFHAQQAAEKMLKCYLASQNIAIPRIHDLQILCEMCGEREKRFDEIYTASIMLTRYGVIPRYPAEWGLTEQDASKAIEDADAVMSFVAELLSDSIAG
ncbi:MAG: HEPN domain-containing protein [Peptococcaceae bacterium]|nr:HEPN domain-containing protein [Peptococcaceae bacterium]